MREASKPTSELLETVRPLAYAIAREFFIPGSDREDVRQEAMIGAWRGLCEFRRDGGRSLENFVALCVRRRLSAVVRMSHARKHGPLTDSLRTVRDPDQGDLVEICDTLEDAKADPVRTASARAELERMGRIIASELTARERRALVHVVNGGEYAGVKWIDNALQRARVKLTDPLCETRNAA